MAPLALSCEKEHLDNSHWLFSNCPAGRITSSVWGFKVPLIQLGQASPTLADFSFFSPPRRHSFSLLHSGFLGVESLLWWENIGCATQGKQSRGGECPYWGDIHLRQNSSHSAAVTLLTKYCQDLFPLFPSDRMFIMFVQFTSLSRSYCTAVAHIWQAIFTCENKMKSHVNRTFSLVIVNLNVQMCSFHFHVSYICYICRMFFSHVDKNFHMRLHIAVTW